MEYSDAQGSASAGTGPWPIVEHSRFAIPRSRRISNKKLPLVVCDSCKCHILKVWTARTKKNYGQLFYTRPTRTVRIVCCKNFVKSILCELNWLVCFDLAIERRCWLSILGVGGGIWAVLGWPKNGASRLRTCFWVDHNSTSNSNCGAQGEKWRINEWRTN